MIRRSNIALGGFAALMVLTSGAESAIPIDPRCQRLGDSSKSNQIACSCGVKYGGVVKHSHGRYVWYMPMRTAHLPPAFRQCVKENGGEY
jgi:hypothetical protein